MVGKPVETEEHCNQCGCNRTFRLDVVTFKTYSCCKCGFEKEADEVLGSKNKEPKPKPAVRPVDTPNDNDDDEYPPIAPI